jgi:hypothetical protein
LFSRFRKLGDHYLIAGGILLLWLQLDVLAIIKLACIVVRISFIDFFIEFRLVYIVIAITAFFLSKEYARRLVRKVLIEKIFIRKVPMVEVWLFMLISLLFFLVVMIGW